MNIKKNWGPYQYKGLSSGCLQ